MSERIGQFSHSWHGLNVFVCLPVGTGRVVSVSKLVHVQKYMLYKYYFIVY